MVYLTRLTLTDAGIKLAGHDRRGLHGLIGLAADPRPGAPRTLWCMPTRDTAIVQSATPLKADRLAGIATITHQTDRPLHHAGMQVEVSTICNPIVRHGSKHAALPADRRTEWLQARLAGCVALGAVEYEALRPVHVRKPGRVASFAPVGYYAIGTVTDPSMLNELALTGIGSGKAYGFGLLLTGQVPR